MTRLISICLITLILTGCASSRPSDSNDKYKQHRKAKTQ